MDMICKTIPLQVKYPVSPANEDDAPSLTTYILDSFQTKPGKAVIICPGGGYEYRSPREGEPVAMRFLAAGIQAFVLNYSVAPVRYPNAVLELAAAVATVKSNARVWNIDPDQVFIAGFSAGGHLCATLGTLWNDAMFSRALGERYPAFSWKPNGMILCYPVITMLQNTHGGSRNSLLGKNATDDQYKALSLELRVTKETVPAFLWHTVDDGAVPVENTLMFAAGMQKAQVPFEMHIFETGVHGLSLCDETTAKEPAHIAPRNSSWIQLAIAWLMADR